MQFKIITSAKSVTPVQILNRIGGKTEKFCSPMISCKTMKTILYENLEKRFLEWEKNGFKKDLLALPSAIIFHVCIVISNHTVFEINLHLHAGFSKS